MKKSVFNFFWELSAMVLLFALAALNDGFSQTSRGTVQGAVKDRTGGVLPGATVELTNTATGVVRSTITNEAGMYRFDAVDLGKYDIKITASSFKAFTSKAVSVEANRTATIDATLEVGVGEVVVDVSAAASELLVKDAPLRGGNFESEQVARLPIPALEPISLARTLPGVIAPSGTATFGNGGANTQFSTNGQRPRGNNYLLDGTENNDISVGGRAQAFNILDAVQEVSVQTGNYGSEFGRAGGAVINVITKSGSNDFHGTGLWQYRSQKFDSRPNLDIVNNTPKSVFHRNIYGFTLGGPIIKNKTFFFGGFQYDRLTSSRNFSFRLPTADAVTRLRALFPSNPRLNLYLGLLGDLRGDPGANPLVIALGADPRTRVDRGAANFGSRSITLAEQDEGPQWLVRIDHNFSEKHSVSSRYIYASNTSSPSSVYFPGFIQDFKGRDQNLLLSDTYTFNPTWTNEFRFSYGRIGFNFPIGSGSPLANTLPEFTITDLSLRGDRLSLGIASNIPQFRFANNWLWQETQTKIVGRHTFRYGVEFLRQLAAQRPPFNERGSFTYRDGGGYTAFANFLDDFSGPAGSASRNFGDPVYYPNLFRQSYFFQDTWKTRPTLTLTLGLRYENFGQPANGAFKFPAFAGFDPAQFLVPNKVKRADKNFGPSVGFAWSPSFKDGFWGTLIGDGKTVLRGGFQVTYDTFFNNLLSNIAADSPNTISTSQVAGNVGRGLPNFSTLLPTSARQPRISDNQTSVFSKDLRNPYTERWSLGFQRELPSKILLDLSYVGSESHKLFTNEDINVLQPNGRRLFPNFGIRRIRGNSGNSNYHSMQLKVDRRFANGFLLTSSYTWSRNIDSTSEVFANAFTSPSLTSLPISQGGLRLDRAVSDLHRKHRYIIAYVWDLPGPKTGYLRPLFGGWSVTGITTFQSGTPFTVENGFDRNGDGIASDRPDVGNPNAPLNTRARVFAGCPTGYLNPDTNSCVRPTDVHFIEGRGFPNPSTVGRNTVFTKGLQTWDLNLAKTIFVTERMKLEFRWETFNIFNRSNYVNAPNRNVANPTGGFRFLNLAFTNNCAPSATCTPRTMRGQLRAVF